MRGFLKSALRRFASSPLARELGCDYATSQEVQAGLLAQYIAMRGWPRERLPKLSEMGFQKFSQFEEDGLLLYIFGLIGATNKTVVELCAGIGSECMAANLIINHGWRGYLFDGDAENVRRGKAFFAGRKSLLGSQPEYRSVWLHAETVNDTLRDAGVSGPIDLLSLDIDGMDYWVWKAIDAIQPRVCIFETVNYIPSDMALTVPYDPAFRMKTEGPWQYFRGASTPAMVKAAREKGYRLVGAHRHGFNCIFMQNGVGEEYFPEVSVASVHDNHGTREGQKAIWPLIKDMNWQKV